MIGAASYGDSFTTGGLGLATPIEYMTTIESNYSVAPLDKAVASTGAPAAPSLRDRRSHHAQDPYGRRGQAGQDGGRHVQHVRRGA